MTVPAGYAQMAADPTTDLGVLAQLAHEHPELRPVIASNPSTYDGLLEWLGALREPEVDAALARRRGEPDPSAPWREPTRALTLAWGLYDVRYWFGVGVFTLALLVGFLPYFDGGFIARVPALLLALGAAWIMPSTIARRGIASGIIVVSTLLTFIISWDFGYMLAQPIYAAAPVAVWLVLRARPGLAYLTLLVGLPYLLFIHLQNLVPFYGPEVRISEYNWWYPLAALISFLLLMGCIVGAAFIAVAIARRPARAAAVAAPYSGPPVDSSRTNTLAILALVFGFGGGVLGIVFGHLARAQIRRTGEQGWALATVGLVLGYVGIGGLLFTLIIVFVIVRPLLGLA
jgi:hypothetical protein